MMSAFLFMLPATMLIYCTVKNGLPFLTAPICLHVHKYVYFHHQQHHIFQACHHRLRLHLLLHPCLPLNLHCQCHIFQVCHRRLRLCLILHRCLPLHLRLNRLLPFIVLLYWLHCFFSYLDSLKHFFCCQSSADHTMRFTANSVSFSSPPEELSSLPLNHEQPQSQSPDVTQPPPPAPLPPKKNYSLIYENTKNTTLYAVAEIC